MGWDGDEMGQAAEEGIIALYGIDTFLPFFSPTNKLDWPNPTVPHTQYPLQPSPRFPDPGYTSVTTFLSRPLPDLVLSLPLVPFPLHPSLSTYNILILSTTLTAKLSPAACISSMHGCNLDRDPRSINFDQILYTHWLFSRPPLQFIPLLYLCARNRHFTPYPLPVIFASFLYSTRNNQRNIFSTFIAASSSAHMCTYPNTCSAV